MQERSELEFEEEEEEGWEEVLVEVELEGDNVVDDVHIWL
jgi:hypothetical protein